MSRRIRGGRSSAIDGRTTGHADDVISQRIRKRIEEAFGWVNTIAGQENTKFRGRERVGRAFTFATAAYNLARLPKLMNAPADCQLIGRWRVRSPVSGWYRRASTTRGTSRSFQENAAGT
jgi:hypothetical protein